ncbi:hypothetical protein HDU93_005573 [Gonapodya sp. JEL0774]|nr:hypothetical protein HDU93_005573 [Gonapodya sp. JEL0774]
MESEPSFKDFTRNGSPMELNIQQQQEDYQQMNNAISNAINAVNAANALSVGDITTSITGTPSNSNHHHHQPAPSSTSSSNSSNSDRNLPSNLNAGCVHLLALKRGANWAAFSRAFEATAFQLEGVVVGEQHDNADKMDTGENRKGEVAMVMGKLELICERARILGHSLASASSLPSMPSSSPPPPPMTIASADRIAQHRFRTVNEPPRGNEASALKIRGSAGKCATGLRGLRNIGSTCLAGYQQQDAHEFLIAALDGVHSGCCETAPNLDPTKCRCVVHQTFAGLLQSDVKCLRCGSVTTKVDSFMDISLHITRPTPPVAAVPSGTAANRRPGQPGRPPKAPTGVAAATGVGGSETVTLAECLERFTQPERLHAAYDCKRCGSKQEVTKRITVKRGPQVLCVQLKRFEHNTLVGTKIDSFVKLPAELDLQAYTTAAVNAREAEAAAMDGTTGGAKDIGNEIEGKDKMRIANRERESPYVLYAVIEHFGNINSGHYRCYVKSRGQWFVFDDHAVSLVDEKYVMSVKA